MDKLDLTMMIIGIVCGGLLIAGLITRSVSSSTSYKNKRPERVKKFYRKCKKAGVTSLRTTAQIKEAISISLCLPKDEMPHGDIVKLYQLMKEGERLETGRPHEPSDDYPPQEVLDAFYPFAMELGASMPAPPSGTKDASVIGRAVAGGVVAGPVGAVVGAISAVDKNNRNSREQQ